MPARIEDYALIGDLETAALIDRGGTLEWMCLPRFDSDACFAALLGDRTNGCWELGPAGAVTAARRRYLGDSLVLETELATATGTIAITDCMPIREGAPRVVRVVACTAGEVEVATRLAPRFGYGDHRPWIRGDDGRFEIIAAPDALTVRAEAPLEIRDGELVGVFALRAGESAAFQLVWHAAHDDAPDLGDPRAAIAATCRWWRAWIDRCAYDGPWRAMVVRSLITLKALTYAPTGGIIAAPTTSLPEQLGGVRNWDYRFCWLRDTSLTLSALIDAGYEAEAHAFARWLERAIRGEPDRVQIMYGVTGEPRLTEVEVPWLSGYEGSRPVRIGNAASEQLQLDVYGELVECFHQARVRGVEFAADIWDLELDLIAHLETIWSLPDRGIWEVRGARQHFTFSKIMVWVAFDRMIKDAEALDLPGPVARWKAIRARIHDEVCANGFDRERGTFTQAYGEPGVDASLLLIAQLGFLPANDPRVTGTVSAIRADLLHGGLVHRYDTTIADDGLPPGEGAFLPCSFWLADALDLQGDHDAARTYFEQLLDICNDLGLLSEQLDPSTRRLVGNFPQAFSHVALVRTAIRLGTSASPSRDEQT